MRYLASAVRWTVEDRLGNVVYVTDERIAHIQQRHLSHLPQDDVRSKVLEVLRTGRRHLDEDRSDTYRYNAAASGLGGQNEYLVVSVRFESEQVLGGSEVNNFVTTAWPARYYP